LRGLKERLPTGKEPSAFFYNLEKRVQLHAGRHPAVFYPLYRLARKNPAQAVSPETQLVIEGFPRSANTFAVLAFRQAQREKVRLAHNLHVPAQVIRAVRWRIPALVLIRAPGDAVLSFVVRDRISVDQAIRHYVSFYETVAEYRDGFTLGTFEEVTGDYGTVIRRINARFGTAYTPFRHDERNVGKVFARMEKGYRRRHAEASVEARISRPSPVRERMKLEVSHKLEDPRRRTLISAARAVYEYLTGPGS
jgi:hypothetical protein